MKQNIYNAKFRTKQIFDLSCNSTETPSTNQVFYWMTYQDSKLFSNYKLSDSTIITKQVLPKEISISKEGGNALVEMEDGLYVPSNQGNSNPSNKMIEFTTSNSSSVTWNENVATFTHNMNCIPLIAIYDDNLEQILYGIKVINGNSFSIDFKDKTVITGTWKMIVSYGVAYE